MVDIKDLKKLVAFLRKAGVYEFKSDGLEIKIRDEIPKRSYRKAKQHVIDPTLNIPSEGPTEEELLYWSSGGVPANSEESN